MQKDGRETTNDPDGLGSIRSSADSRRVEDPAHVDAAATAQGTPMKADRAKAVGPKADPSKAAPAAEAKSAPAADVGNPPEGAEQASDGEVENPNLTRQSSLWRWCILPDEDPDEFEDLHQALVDDLNPSGCYEERLVMSIAMADWEMIRHRNMIVMHLRNGFRSQGERFVASLASYLAVSDMRKSEGDGWTANLLSSDPRVRSRAEGNLAKHRLTRREILAATYEDKQGTIDYHERRIADLERRRRQLFKDFEALKQLRKIRNIEDAEIIPS